MMKRSRKAGFSPQELENNGNPVHVETYKCEASQRQDRDAGVKNAVADLEIPRTDLTLLRKIGDGAFGVVHEATLITGAGSTKVAVKCAKESDNELDKAEQSLTVELLTMRNIGQHPNIVRLIGACSSKRALCIVTEYLSGGTLLEFVRRLRAENGEAFAKVSEHLLLRLALGVCDSMVHLTECGVIHGDLAARNVLLDACGTPKLCDFGFSRDYQGSKLLSSGSKDKQCKLPVKWMAMESLRYNRFTEKSDVWSFGVVLWEVFTLGGSPYPGVPSRHLLKRLLIGYRMEKPLHCSDELYDVMLSCWVAERADRIGFPEVQLALTRLLTYPDREDFIKLETLKCLYPYMDLSQNGNNGCIIDTK